MVANTARPDTRGRTAEQRGPLFDNRVWNHPRCRRAPRPHWVSGSPERWAGQSHTLCIGPG